MLFPLFFAGVVVLLGTQDRAVKKEPSSIYNSQCAACHGVEGNGDGVIAKYLDPKPRDFTLGQFRIVSTENGVPTDLDIINSIERGMPGSWMPSWKTLTEDEKLSLVAYIRKLTAEGIRRRITQDLQSRGEKISEEDLEAVVRRKTVPGSPISIPPEPRVSESGLEHGRRTFLRNCASCHGPEGKGDGLAKIEDDRGASFRPRDLTKGIFKGSSDANSLFRRIYAGMPGSPMPGFFHLEPETIWDLVHYLRTLPTPGSEERTLPVRRSISAKRQNSLPESPLAKAWNEIPGTFISLMPLRWHDLRVEGLIVRAVHDGKELAIQVSWIDTSRNDTDYGSTELQDGLGIELFSGPEEPVVGTVDPKLFLNLWFWRANWEMERRGDSETSAFDSKTSWAPYPWAKDDSLAKSEGRSKTPVQSLKSVRSSADWMDPGWAVVFRRALAAGNSEVNLEPGSRISISFTVIDAAQDQRKMQTSVSVWHDLFLDH